MFKVQQAIPTLHSLLTMYEHGEIKVQAIKRTFRLLENFHFIFTAITSQRSSGGIAFMYSRAARDIRHATSANKRAAEIRVLENKLRDKIPSIEEFQIGFEELLFSREYSRQRKLVRYVLQRIDEYHSGGGSPKDYDQYSIEHIASEDTKGMDDEIIAEIGNLIFVPEKLNSEVLKNKKFAEKKRILVENQIPLDPILKNATKWGEDEIQERTKFLAAAAYNDIWKT